MLIPASDSSLPALGPWAYCFYKGDRLRSEVKLLAAYFTGALKTSDIVSGCQLLHRSFGAPLPQQEVVDPFTHFQAQLPHSSNLMQASQQYLAAADIPDALMFFVLYKKIPEYSDNQEKRILLLQRLAYLLCLRFPQRPDLPFQVLIRDPIGFLLRSTPKKLLRANCWYSRPEPYSQQLQAAWVKGQYEAMWLGTAHARLDARSFPVTDHHIRALSILGEADCSLFLFQQIYNANPSQFQLGSISNMIFMAFGCKSIDLPFINVLANHFNLLALDSIALPSSELPEVAARSLCVREKPLLIVVSSDLRQHPVGRFWLPIARALREKFHVISVVGHPSDKDQIRSELKQVSDEWWPLDSSCLPQMAARIKEVSPDLLIDLGGHTADNHPALLSHRLAKVQATYLGFYGPSYAKCCDWWIIDHVLERWLSTSYPGSEKIWSLPGPSLCYLPSLHGLPDVHEIRYKNPSHIVFGSFNHSRKLTRSSQQRFGQILHANPDAVLQFRSHSFHDPAVRRRFLIRLQDMGIAPHQLQPLPFAPSSAEAMLDYGRIHLHFDTFPVSGTTTTLDSLAMGIPVLTCPTPYYAGAISAAILEHAGLADHICSDPAHLPNHARWLAERYRSVSSRRALAQQVRQSPVCDDQSMPRMFVHQLQQMLRQKFNS